MTLHRFFVPPSQIRGSTISLDDPQQIHHLRDVLRLGVGDQLMAFDGQGSQWLGTIARAGARRVVIHLDEPRDRPERSVAVWLGQALLKADRFEWVIQKATELGVAALSPLITRHTVVRLSSEQALTRRQRWQRIATEAAKQCRRATIPVIHPPLSLEALLRQVAAPACCDTPSAAWKVPPRSAEGASLILIPTLSVTTIPLQEVLSAHQAPQEVEPHGQARGAEPRTEGPAPRPIHPKTHPGSPGAWVVALIGPEGDFSPEEVALAERFGARPVSLGPFTLRAETAAIATMAMLQYALVS